MSCKGEGGKTGWIANCGRSCDCDGINHHYDRGDFEELRALVCKYLDAVEAEQNQATVLCELTKLMSDGYGWQPKTERE